MTTQPASNAKAISTIPMCVETDGVDGTFEHYIYRVEHVVCIYLEEGDDIYNRREAISCQKWLKKHAPHSQYASVRF